MVDSAYLLGDDLSISPVAPQRFPSCVQHVCKDAEARGKRGDDDG